MKIEPRRNSNYRISKNNDERFKTNKYRSSNCFMIKFDVNNIAESLWLEREDIIREFKDARVISRFSEYWAMKLYKFNMMKNTNNEGYDGIFDNPLFGDQRIGIRSLTNGGVKFQKSKYMGSGRECNKEKLITSLKEVDIEIVIDIIDFPFVIFFPLEVSKLILLVEEGMLTCSGMKKEKFYNIFVDEEVYNNIDKYKKIIEI